MVAKVALYVFLVLLFLSAAKTHGRQHRLERELEGHWQVSFTSKNHPWVENFWLKQRIVYWTIASLVAITLTAKRWKVQQTKWSRFLLLFVTVATSMIVAFISTGLLSATRLFFKLRGGIPFPNQEWLQDALWGSIGWWVLTLLLAGLLLFWIKPASR